MSQYLCWAASCAAPLFFLNISAKIFKLLRPLHTTHKTAKIFLKKIVVKIVANFWKKSLQLWKTGAVCMGDKCIFAVTCVVCRGLEVDLVWILSFIWHSHFLKDLFNYKYLQKCRKKTNRQGKLLCLLLNISNYGTSRFVTTLSILYHFYDWHFNTDYIQSKTCIECWRIWNPTISSWNFYGHVSIIQANFQ